MVRKDSVPQLRHRLTGNAGTLPWKAVRFVLFMPDWLSLVHPRATKTR
jgi:hypothetical protein